jgi:ferrous iron transport protein A
MQTDLNSLTLDQLKRGQTAVVSALTCAGSNRRRLMDLGILPGTRMQVEMKSPLGDPAAYRVRGAVIALRRQQAHAIQIQLEETASS